MAHVKMLGLVPNKDVRIEITMWYHFSQREPVCKEHQCCCKSWEHFKGFWPLLGDLSAPKYSSLGMLSTLNEGRWLKEPGKQSLFDFPGPSCIPPFLPLTNHRNQNFSSCWWVMETRIPFPINKPLNPERSLYPFSLFPWRPSFQRSPPLYPGGRNATQRSQEESEQKGLAEFSPTI